MYLYFFFQYMKFPFYYILYNSSFIMTTLKKNLVTATTRRATFKMNYFKCEQPNENTSKT